MRQLKSLQPPDWSYFAAAWGVVVVGLGFILMSEGELYGQLGRLLTLLGLVLLAYSLRPSLRSLSGRTEPSVQTLAPEDRASTVPVSANPEIERGLKCSWWVLPIGWQVYKHGIHVRVETEKRVSAGIRIVCNRPIHEVRAYAETVGLTETTGVPMNYPETDRPSASWLFTPLFNYPSQRKLRLDADLYSTEPLTPILVETIKPTGVASAP